MSPPKQSIFVCAMGEVFDHSKKRKYFGSEQSASLDVTGPGVLGECLRHVLGDDDAVFRPGILQLATLNFHLLRSVLRASDRKHIVELAPGETLIELLQGGVAYEKQESTPCQPGEHYSTLYMSKNVYRADGDD